MGLSNCKLFADDSKFYCARDSVDNGDFVRTLKRFEMWAETWQMKVAIQKCFVLSMGNATVPECIYSLGGNDLVNVKSIRDLGITVSKNLKFSEHCCKISSIAHARVCCTFKCFYSCDPYWLTRAYTTYVRPLLESNSQVFNPYLKKDITVLERVQKYFTRTVCKRAGISFNDYSHRLKLLNLQSLEHRRVILDLTLLYKIFYRLIDLDFNSYFKHKYHAYSTRNSEYNSRQIISILSTDNAVLQSCFFHRVVKFWNFLPDNVVLSPSLCSFRSRLLGVDLSSFCVYY